MESNLLRFSKGNAYLPKDTYTFSLPSGWTCPGADACLSKCDRTTGKIKDGPNTKFRCYAATCERYPAVRAAVWHNFDLLKGLTSYGAMSLILESIPPKAKNLRIHVHGDFFSQDYFDAWIGAAGVRRDMRFWAFTKSVPFWVARLNAIPSNLELQASLGGKHDALAHLHRLKFAKVVFSEEQAAAEGLEFDHDDSKAMAPGPSFALPVHGQQPAGSEASVAAKRLHGLRSKGKQS